MTTDKLHIEKNRLSDINQKISLLKRKHPAFNWLNGNRNQLSIWKDELTKKINEMDHLNNELIQIQDAIKNQAEKINIHNMSSVESVIQKYMEAVDLKVAQLDKLDRETHEIKGQINNCSVPEYFQYCDLISEQKSLEKSILENDTSQPSLLAAFVFNAKQKRTLPVNAVAELNRYLNTLWGTEFSDKHKLTPNYDKESEIHFLNEHGRPIITVSERCIQMRDMHPSKNESLAKAMLEMYLKSVESDPSPIHQTSGPDADYLEKKLALALKEKGQEDHKINGRLVTTILGIEKKPEQLPSPMAPTQTTTTEAATSPSDKVATEKEPPPLLTTSKKGKEVDKDSGITPMIVKTEPLPDWYTKSLEQDATADNSTPTMRR